MESQIVFSEDWKPKKIADLVVKTEQINPANDPEKEFEYIDVSSISNETFRIMSSTKILGKDAPSRARKSVKTDDVLFATVRPTLKRVAIVPAELDNQVCSTGYCVLRAKDEEALGEYLFFSLLTPAFMERMASIQKGASYPAVTDKEVKDTIILIPPKNERKNIVHILSTLQKAIQKQEEIINTTVSLKKSLLNKLFTEGTRGEPLKQTEIGMIPESWGIVPISSLGKVVTGSTPKTSVAEYYEPAEYDFIAPVDIGKSWIVENAQKKISSFGLVVSRPLPKNAVLAVCIGSTIGKVGLTSKETSATNQQINAVVCDESVNNPRFIYYLLHFYSNLWKEAATPSPVPILTKGQFEKIQIPCTDDLKEQTTIAESLEVFENKLKFHQKKKYIYENLFKTLLNDLMTGSIRVHDIDFHLKLSSTTTEGAPPKTVTV